MHPDVKHVVGNCSSSLLVIADFEDTSLTLSQAVQALAHELSQSLAHSEMGATEVMEEYNRMHGTTFQAGSPFIFTTPIGERAACTRRQVKSHVQVWKRWMQV